MAVPLIFAHRGASSGARENTLAAFEAALKAGADGVELDVRVTADGVPVVIHDEKLGRLTGQRSNVSETRWEDLPRHRPAGERIPRLDEALDLLLPRIAVEVEIKPGVPAEPVIEVFRRMNAQSRLFAGSFDRAILRELRAGMPKLPLILIQDKLDPRILRAGPVSGAARLAFELRRAEWEGLSLRRNVLPEAEWVTGLLALGVQLSFWTVNTLRDARRLASWGAPILITDHPEKLRRALTPPHPPNAVK